MGYAERNNRRKRLRAQEARRQYLTTAKDFELSLADKRERDALTELSDFGTGKTIIQPVEVPHSEQHFCCWDCYSVEARLRNWPEKTKTPKDAIVPGIPGNPASRCCFCGCRFVTAARVKAKPGGILCKGKLYRHA